MSPYQDFNQYIDTASTESPQVKSGDYDSAWYEILTGNDFITGNDLFQTEAPIYDISPVLTSSMTTPSLVIDGDLNDSPIFASSSFAASPSIEPALAFFPDLTSDASVAATARRSLMQMSIAPSVTIPVDDSAPLTTIPGNSSLSPALNIPWNTEATSSSLTDDLDILQNTSSSSPLLSGYSGNNTANNSPKSSSTVLSSPSTPSLNKSNSRNRKRSNADVDKDPQIVADELALKRAKNTDAARRSRLRRVMKMESLEKQVNELKSENNDLQTRIAVLESEKKGLEDKNKEKESRVHLLELQLAEAHERLIKSNSNSNSNSSNPGLGC